MWQKYLQPASLDDALALLSEHRDQARIVNGGTDLLIEIERKLRNPSVVIDVSRIPGLDQARLENGVFHLGPSVTHNQVVANPDLVKLAYPLARACWVVGAPQIRNRGTVAGNLITASPANDTISPLWALGARVTLASAARGKRELALGEFMLGVRKTALAPDEMLVDISFPALAIQRIEDHPHEHGTFIKLGLRRAQAISVVNAAVVLRWRDSTISSASIALGSVAPTIVSAREAEAFLAGKALQEDTIEEAARLATRAAKPIDDIRGTADYRREMVRVLVARALEQLRDGTECADLPPSPVLLWGKTRGAYSSLSKAVETPDVIETVVNGRTYAVRGAGTKTLLRMLREDIGLNGTKEGCAEGECGACTVFLDGIAVMSCLVPAPRAHRTDIVTIEGLAKEGVLHPVQSAFVDAGAVQCGYCTPGFIMSGVKLLEENPQPSREDIRQALTGNLCRCTGYYKIVEAIERAPPKG